MTAEAVTFDGADWATPKTITVTAVDDSTTETTPHTGTVTITTASIADPAFDALTTTPVSVDIADNDNPSVIVTDPAPLTMDENDVGSDPERQVGFHLGSIPTGTITITALSDGQVGLQTFPQLDVQLD